MREKRLKDGHTAYYWAPQRRDLKAGFSLHSEALGTDYGAAIERAAQLNAHLDAWRSGQGTEKSLDLSSKFGTLGWLFERYRRSAAYERVSERAQPEYMRGLARIEDMETKIGVKVGELPVAAITPSAVDKIYAKLQWGPRGKRVRQANLSIDVARRAWDVVHRLHSTAVPVDNPWRGVLKVTSKNTKPAATRFEAYELATKLRELGEPHLGAAALICFEWLQRPENVLAGKMTWADYRSSEQPSLVRILHRKTGEIVWMPLEDGDGLLYPELEAYLAGLPRLGLPIVLTAGVRGPARPYSMAYAQRRVREARAAAGLGNHVTLDACRHGGMTELGDAELTEQGVMTLSGHKTAQAARLYVKRTRTQRLTAARKRRSWVEANEPGSNVGIERQAESRNGSEGGR
jgi:hypothetical protein